MGRDPHTHLARRRRTRAPLIQERCSTRTHETYLYGDFRAFADVGGRVEALREPGARTATSDPVVAARLYADRVAYYKDLRARDRPSASDAQPNGVAVDRPSSEAGPPSASAPGDGHRIRLSAMIRLHLERKSLPRSGRRASTVRRDKICLAVIQRILGDPYLDEVTPARCDAFVLTREREPGVRAGTTVAPRTILNELHAVSNLFKRAVAMGYASENPVRRMAEKPTVRSMEADFLVRAEAARLLDAAVELDDEARRAAEAARLRREAKKCGDARRRGPARELRVRARALLGPNGLRHPNVGRQYTELEAIIALLLYTGMRLSEALGLRVDDIDFIGKKIWILPTELRQLKRDRHRREVPLWPALELILRDYLRRTGFREGLLFPGRRGGMLVSLRKAIRRCVERAGLGDGRRVTAHSLRHTFATQLLQTLVRTDSGQLAVRSSFDAARRLGHRSSALVDDVYGHLVPHPAYSEILSYEGPRRYPATRLGDPDSPRQSPAS